MEGLVQLLDRDAVGLGALLHRFLAAGQRLGDGFPCHALFRERVELVDLGRGPRRFVAFEPVLHAMTSRSTAAPRISIGSSRPWHSPMSPPPPRLNSRPGQRGRGTAGGSGGP